MKNTNVIHYFTTTYTSFIKVTLQIKNATRCKSVPKTFLPRHSRKHKPPPHWPAPCALGAGATSRNLREPPQEANTPPTATPGHPKPRRTNSRDGRHAADHGQQEREPAGRLFSASQDRQLCPHPGSPIFEPDKVFCARASKELCNSEKRQRGPVKIFALLPPFLMVHFFRTFAAVSIVNYQLSIINCRRSPGTAETQYLIYNI